jgi:hypothetical protein
MLASKVFIDIIAESCQEAGWSAQRIISAPQLVRGMKLSMKQLYNSNVSNNNANLILSAKRQPNEVDYSKMGAKQHFDQ